MPSHEQERDYLMNSELDALKARTHTTLQQAIGDINLALADPGMRVSILEQLKHKLVLEDMYIRGDNDD